MIQIRRKDSDFFANFDKKHTVYIIKLLTDRYYKEKITKELLETIAGLAYAILEDLGCLLEESNNVLDDIRQTENNIERLFDWIRSEENG